MRLLLAVVMLAPGTAFAAAGDIGCIEAKLGPDAMARIGDQIVAKADGGQPLESSLDQDRDPTIAARNACRATNRWSNEATDLAVNYVQARATRSGVERALVADGLVPAQIAADYANMPAEDRRSIIGGKMPSAAMMARIRGYGKGPASDARTRVVRHVAMYYSALAAIEFYPPEFARA